MGDKTPKGIKYSLPYCLFYSRRYKKEIWESTVRIASTRADIFLSELHDKNLVEVVHPRKSQQRCLCVQVNKQRLLDKKLGVDNSLVTLTHTSKSFTKEKNR